MKLKNTVKTILTFMSGHVRGLRLGIFLGAGAFTGIAAVFFMWAFEFVLKYPLAGFIGPWIWIAAPCLFLFSVEMIRRTAPFADGAGIPQTVFAASHLTETSLNQLKPLVSMKTMAVKITALLLAVWAGASTGREGPTVHVAACLFLGIVLLAQKFTKLKMDPRSAVIAGGAAGLAAAFNTPLAGVTFAIEELCPDYFSAIKESVLMAIIIAGIAAKSLIGEYAYFGRLETPAQVSLPTVVLIGIAGGLFGAFFSTVLYKGRRAASLLQRSGVWRYLVPVLFALMLLGINHFSAINLLGPGNKVVEGLVTGELKSAGNFSFLKMLATLFTYWSGVAGGIFAPCLAMGAGLGVNVGSLTGDVSASCALIGMAALLAGTIQAPITAFVIIFEMAGHHELLLPIMLSSLISVLTAKAVGAKHLYQTLAGVYGEILGFEDKMKAHG